MGRVDTLRHKMPRAMKRPQADRETSETCPGIHHIQNALERREWLCAPHVVGAGQALMPVRILLKEKTLRWLVADRKIAACAELTALAGTAAALRI